MYHSLVVDKISQRKYKFKYYAITNEAILDGDRLYYRDNHVDLFKSKSSRDDMVEVLENKLTLPQGLTQVFVDLVKTSRDNATITYDSNLQKVEVTPNSVNESQFDFIRMVNQYGNKIVMFDEEGEILHGEITRDERGSFMVDSPLEFKYLYSVDRIMDLPGIIPGAVLLLSKSFGWGKDKTVYMSFLTPEAEQLINGPKIDLEIDTKYWRWEKTVKVNGQWGRLFTQASKHKTLGEKIQFVPETIYKDAFYRVFLDKPELAMLKEVAKEDVIEFGKETVLEKFFEDNPKVINESVFIYEPDTKVIPDEERDPERVGYAGPALIYRTESETPDGFPWRIEYILTDELGEWTKAVSDSDEEHKRYRLGFDPAPSSFRTKDEALVYSITRAYRSGAKYVWNGIRELVFGREEGRRR